MPARSVSFREFILGLLAEQPMSGYDIKRAQKSLGWLIGIPSFGSLYPTLHGLLREGLVTVEVQPAQDRPSRKVYSITDAGRQVLQEWADQPNAPTASLKSFVMQLNIAGNLSHRALASRLNQRREQVAAQRAALQQQMDELKASADLGQRLVTSFGLALASAELDWLNQTLARLSALL
jgi:PadR family transcriptional regulator AphA